LAEPVVWLGLEDFRGMVGADQFPVRIELMRIQSEWIDHGPDPKLIKRLKILPIQPIVKD
jgi:hypothetical protein